MRAVLDPNVIVSALLAPSGAPATVLRAWIDGGYELIGSPQLIAELTRALDYPKLRSRLSRTESEQFIELLRRHAEIVDDPTSAPPANSSDPKDAYLIALAATTRSVIVSGDQRLLGLVGRLPVYSPAAFWDFLSAQR